MMKMNLKIQNLYNMKNKRNNIRNLITNKFKKKTLIQKDFNNLIIKIFQNKIKEIK